MQNQSVTRLRLSSPERLYGLDVIRGIAILFVLLRHAWPEIFGGAGVVGVVMFFALSGYLITGLLARDIEIFGKVRFRRFYVHRFLRLIPPLVALLAGFALIEGFWNLLGDRDEIARSVLVAMTYTMNIPGFDHGSAALEHLWTLATEEQFYLIWPLALLLAFRMKRPTLLTVLCFVLLTVLCAASIVMVYPQVTKIYSLPTSWFTAMLIGALACLEKHRLSRVLCREGWQRIALPGLALTSLTAICLFPEVKDWVATYLILGPFIAVATVVAIFEFARWRSSRVPALMKPLWGLGLVSYAAYLWNYPIAAWVGERPLDAFQGSASIVLTVVAAIVSWFAVERPIAKLRKRVDAKRSQVTSEEVAAQTVAS
ncbi:acyltransferase [Micrococcaceae bacterium Sec5.1]